MMRRLTMAGMLVAVGLLLTGCGGAESVPPTMPGQQGGTAAGSGAPASGGGGGRLVFWHTRRGDQQKLIETLCAEYEKANPGVDLAPEYQGSYGDLNKKVRASIQAKSLPALTVAYESHVAEYMANGVVRPLDDLVKDPEIGLSTKELEAIPAAYLESNRFAQYENQLLSFPFTKSNLVLYYNKSLLASAGFSMPPRTWAEFEKQAAAITKQISSPAYAFTADPSTLDGLIYSFGGEVLSADGKATRFDEPPTVRMLEMLQRMAKAKSLTQVTGDEAPGLFNSQRCAFVIDTSSARARAETDIGRKFEWDVTIIPHADDVQPVTVMYGPNVCIFKATPEQERAAWKFVRWFVSPEITARWARETGYLPVTKAAVELPAMQEFYRKNSRAQHVIETQAAAKGEPNVVGWQEVRDRLEEAAGAVVSGASAPAAAASELKQKADQALAQSKQ